MKGAWVNLLVGLVVVGVSIPLWLEKVPMNNWYGVRIPKSYESDEAWYKLNRFGGQAGVVVGLVITLIGAACLVWPPRSEALALLLLFLPAFMMMPLLVAVFWYAGRI